MLGRMTPGARSEIPGGSERGGQPMLPDYGGACLNNVVPALLHRNHAPVPAWLPAGVAGAEQVVLLVLDGLGFEQLSERRALAPALAGLVGGAITSVAPTTTAAALTSLATGRTPSQHGIVGYRIALGHNVLNVLRWSTPTGDARTRFPPTDFQPIPPFLGEHHPVVSRAEFAQTGFTDAHLAGVRLEGWRVVSSLPVEVGAELAKGESFVYAYYDGIDKVAHEKGLGDHYDAELRAVDHLVEDVLAVLQPGAVLVVTADHGQIEVRTPPIVLDASVVDEVVLFSGEGRFRWLHVEAGRREIVAARCHDLYGDVAWVRTRDEIVAEQWLGPVPTSEIERRLGDVALVAREPVAFFDPSDTGELRLIARHGSLTSAELLIPLLAGTP